MENIKVGDLVVTVTDKSTLIGTVESINEDKMYIEGFDGELSLNSALSFEFFKDFLDGENNNQAALLKEAVKEGKFPVEVEFPVDAGTIEFLVGDNFDSSKVAASIALSMLPAQERDIILKENDKYFITSHKNGGWNNIYLKLPDGFVSSALSKDVVRQQNICSKMSKELYYYLGEKYDVHHSGFKLENMLYFSYLNNTLKFKKGQACIGLSLCVLNFGQENVDSVLTKIEDVFETEYDALIEKLDFLIFG